MLLAVDPGTVVCGCALYDGPVLVCAELVRSRASKHATLSERVKLMAIAVADWQSGVRALAIEVPMSYPKKSKQKGKQQDLILLALVVGAILDRLGVPSATYYPYEWKRQMTKEVTRRRVESRLDPSERAHVTLPARSLQHNVFDAAGIGLHHVGRILF